MAATPLAMQVCGFSFDDAALVLEWHVIGMFAPGFFTGNLIKRFGSLKVMAAGVVLNLICIAIALSGVSRKDLPKSPNGVRAPALRMMSWNPVMSCLLFWGYRVFLNGQSGPLEKQSFGILSTSIHTSARLFDMNFNVSRCVHTPPARPLP
jgi:hypothetical protein